MYDFSLIETGEDFELLCEELLRKEGFNIIVKPYRGPDLGSDLIISKNETDSIGITTATNILVECKHFAKSGRSVREDDVKNILERTVAKGCNKYLLITSTIVSSTISHQLQGITNNPTVPMSATFWAKNNLDSLLSKYPDLAERYLNKIKLNNTENSIEPQVYVAIHKHPDFSQELQKIIGLWNEVQKHIKFTMIQPAHTIEVQLLSSGEISDSESAILADSMRKESGFSESDAIIQFCEKRLYGGHYYRLFTSGTHYNEVPPNTATISLKYMRALVKGEKDSVILELIFLSILHVIAEGVGLNAHKETRDCIMDFDENMSDILKGLKDIKFCSFCESQIKRVGAIFLLDLIKVIKNFSLSHNKTVRISDRMVMRDNRKYILSENYDYDISLSFAGEDRDKAMSLAESLKQKGIKVFYDDFEKNALWGEDLYVYLYDIYRLKSKFCVMFISKYYKDKLWTNHERKAAQERAFIENRPYILPIKIDDTEIPGILSTIAYIRWENGNILNIVDMLVSKIRQS